jgi:hypothetical protein
MKVRKLFVSGCDLFLFGLPAEAQVVRGALLNEDDPTSSKAIMAAFTR